MFSTNSIIKTVVFTVCLTIGGVVQAFVGAMSVSLGEMDKNIGRIQVSFTAEAKFETEEMTAKTRIFYQPGKVRDEMNLGGQEMVMIQRFDLNKFWMLMGQGMYMDIDPEEGSDDAPDYKLISREVIGPESVNGIATTKYKSVYESKDGKFGGFTWFTDDNIAVKGFLVHKTKGEKQRFKFEFTSLKRGKQDDSLFEIPPGYKAFNIGGMLNIDQLRRDAAGNSAPTPENQSASTSNEDAGVVGEIADEAQETATDSVKEETTRAIKDSIRKGIGSFFKR